MSDADDGEKSVGGECGSIYTSSQESRGLTKEYLIEIETNGCRTLVPSVGFPRTHQCLVD